MHEMSIAQNIIDIVKETVNNSEKHSVLSVTVEVGELTAVVPESLKFCYQVMAENSPFCDTELIIKHIPLSGKCKSCHKDFSIKNLLFLCPFCESTEIEVTGGQELNVTELEIE